MQRFSSFALRRAYTTSPRAMQAAAAAAAEANTNATQMVLNFCTPHQPIFKAKVVDKVMLPGAGGEYGVTAKHIPIISQLQPGVVTVVHVNVKQPPIINFWNNRIELIIHLLFFGTFYCILG